MDKLKLSYLSGFFDGEGCITFTKKERISSSGEKKVYKNLRITVNQVNPAPIKLLKEFFDCGYLGKWINKSGRTQFYWTACGDNAVGVLEKIYPYLIVKKEEAMLAIEFQKLPWKKDRKLKNGKESEKIETDLVNRISDLKRTKYLVS